MLMSGSSFISNITYINSIAPNPAASAMNRFNFIIAFGLIAVAASCVQVELRQPETAYGALEMRMSIDEMTKAMTDDELRNSAIVNIYYKDYSGLVRTYAYNEIPSPFYLAVGEYRADVLAGECVAETPSPASWERFC